MKLNLTVWVSTFLSAFFLLSACQDKKKINNSKRLIFAGDILLDRGVRNKIEHVGIESLFHSSIDSIFERSDLVIANLECPATNIQKPINKKFIFKANPFWLKNLKTHNITHLNLANNHAMDQGREGLVDTEINIKNSGLIPLGFGQNHSLACQEVLLISEPRSIYLLSSLRVPSENWTFLEDQPCVCEESINEISERIIDLRQKESNCVILVQLHWGVEHTRKPQTFQKQVAYQLIDAGADGVIGHHTHTVQIIEEYKGKPIFYGIGNFIFDQSKPINNRGILVQLDISSDSFTFDTIPYEIENCTPILCQ